jgi:uncharacterized membrane protein YfcA
MCTFGLAYIVGNLIATYVIKLLNEVFLFIILTVLSTCVTLYLCFLKSPRPHKEAKPDYDDVQVMATDDIDIDVIR